MTPLATALKRLADSPDEYLAYWCLSDGVEFHMAVPWGMDVLEDRFSDKIEFPFTFDNIVRVGLLSEFPQSTFKCDIDQTYLLLDGIVNLCLRSEYGISVAGQPDVDVIWLSSKP